MTNVRLFIEYAGTNYFGWQIQKGHISVQETIQDCIKGFLGEDVSLIGAGRTDTGVHAHNQVANFKTTKILPAAAFTAGLNSILPKDIRIKKTDFADQNFHSRFDAKERIYRYFLKSKIRSIALFREYYSCTKFPLNKKDIVSAAAYLVGTHDFSNFSAGFDKDKAVLRRINYIKIRKTGNFFVIEISANAFLRRMVRGIVGAFIDVGRHYLKPEDFVEFLEKKRKIPNFAPATGLFLWNVKYD